MLILDKKGYDRKVFKRFRMMSDPLAQVTLPVSGSGQLTANEFSELKHRLPDKEIFVVDLREESHFFINGLPVSWHNPDTNKGLSVSEIQQREHELMIFVQERDTIDLMKVMGSREEPYMEPVTLFVQSVETEEDLCQGLGLHYERLPITDRQRPSDETVDQFLLFLTELEPKDWLHFHCKGGAGRTTTLMAMLDMLAHCEKHSLEEIFQRQHVLGGRNLSDMPDEEVWHYNHAQTRLDFMRQFYKYCLARSKGELGSWSEWAL